MTPEEKNDRARLEDDVARGQRIEAFLRDSLIQGVFKGLQVGYYEAWKSAPTPADRERIYSQVSAFDALQEALQSIVLSGERATHDLTVLELSTDQT